MITSDWSLLPGDPRASFTSEVSFTSYTKKDMRPARIAMLATWREREAAGVSHLPQDAQVAAYYLFQHYAAQVRERRNGQTPTLRDGQFSRWMRLLACYSSEASLGLTLSKLKTLAEGQDAAALRGDAVAGMERIASGPVDESLHHRAASSAAC